VPVIGAGEKTREVESAIELSFLGRAPPDVRERLVQNGVVWRFGESEHLNREGVPGRHVTLVVSGLVRVFRLSEDGRQVTVRYLSRGDVGGVPTIFRSGPMTVGSQALVDTTVIRFRSDEWRNAAEEDPRVGLALGDHLCELAGIFQISAITNAFGSVRRRVVWHLLDIATRESSGGDLVAHVTQQQLADATASVREVVQRVLGELVGEGAIASERGTIAILNPIRLSELAAA